MWPHDLDESTVDPKDDIPEQSPMSEKRSFVHRPPERFRHASNKV